MPLKLALIADVHGNVLALDAALADIESHAVDAIVVLGDLVQNGPRPAETLARLMELDTAGAIIIAGNTDIAVADGDYAAAYPWLDEVPVGHSAAAEWARERLDDAHIDYLRRLPSERRLDAGDATLVLACHGSPGSQTSGLAADLDPAITVQRVTRTDARVIACGHTHIADVRELGRKLIVNPGSCGYAFDDSPDACWALLEVSSGTEPSAILKRPTYDAQTAAEEVSERGLPADVYRAAADPYREVREVSTFDQGRRVVVTGMGAVTPLGPDVPTFWRRLVAGESGVARTQAFDPENVRSQMAGEVDDFDASGILDRKELRRNDRTTQLALVSTHEAMQSAGLPERLEGTLAEETGMLLGSGLGGTTTLIEQIATWRVRGPDKVSPFFIPMAIANMASGQAAISFGALGPNFSTTSACASSGHAIGEGYEMIRRGDAEVMISGGCEAPVLEAMVAAFAAMRALSTRNDEPAAASRPFDAGRDGFVVAEGAGVIVLEELSHAEARGAPILAEVIGYGATADAHHITTPSPGGSGAVRAARRALDKAGVDATVIDLVSAHATSTPEGDPTELQAINAIVGDRASEVSVTATKSAIGHTLGAAGAVAAVATLKSMEEGVVPPTLNLDDADPAAGSLDLTPHTARRRDVDVALINAFGFGGQNSAVLLRRWAA